MNVREDIPAGAATPHLGQVAAESDISELHSRHCTSATNVPSSRFDDLAIPGERLDAPAEVQLFTFARLCRAHSLRNVPNCYST